MFTTRHILSFFVPAFVLALTGCSPRAVREAQEVVAEADSLRAEGRAYTDSVAIAEAYNTLEKWQHIYPTDYARACYYYGRLLREKDDPVSAMQVFINASHSHAHDYHILGRIYSNMGSISHLTGDYQLSYDMYAHSADMFLQNADTLLYYCALNNMAVELAEQGKKVETLTFLEQIIQNNQDTSVIARAFETKAEMYRVVEEFDSALYWINQTKQFGEISPYGTIIKAQSFSRLGASDSAIHYASLIMADSSALYHAKFNALYIIYHNDTTLSRDSIREIASLREDIRYYDYEPEKEKLTVAVQILQDDLTCKPNIMWLYAIIGTLVVVGMVAGLYIKRKRKQHKLLSQELSDLEELAKDKAENMRMQVEDNCKLFIQSSDIGKELHWTNFDQMCIVVNHYFFHLATKLRQTGVLTETETRLCVLTLIGLDRKSISDILPYALNSVGKLKDQTAKKLGTTGKELRSFLLKMAVER